MIRQLVASEEPAWLSGLTSDTIATGPLPLRDILRNSLYYPACGLDGDPVKYLAGLVRSFVYVDYGCDEDEFEAELREPGFRGYSVLAKRAVSESELLPRGWKPAPRHPRDVMPPGWDGPKGRPFCKWVVLEQRHGDFKGEGSRISLLYWHHDGVEAFRALYMARHLVPRAIAIIQSGEGFGGNYTDFRDPDGILARDILDNPAGQPELLLYGGFGSRKPYREPCWPPFKKHVGFLEKAGGGSIGVWRNLGG